MFWKAHNIKKTCNWSLPTYIVGHHVSYFSDPVPWNRDNLNFFHWHLERDKTKASSLESSLTVRGDRWELDFVNRCLFCTFCPITDGPSPVESFHFHFSIVLFSQSHLFHSAMLVFFDCSPSASLHVTPGEKMYSLLANKNINHHLQS